MRCSNGQCALGCRCLSPRVRVAVRVHRGRQQGWTEQDPIVAEAGQTDAQWNLQAIVYALQWWTLILAEQMRALHDDFDTPSTLLQPGYTGLPIQERGSAIGSQCCRADCGNTA